MNMVNSFYNNAPIEWIMGKNNELKKENYDACDALICALAYININHYGLDEPTIISSEKIIENNLMTYKYKTKIWNKTFEKTLILNQK